MVSPPKKQRTITYQRAVWENEDGTYPTLQSVLTSCLSGLPNAIDTQLDLRSGRAEVRHRLLRNTHLCIHIASWTEREAMSTVPHTAQVVDADLDSQAPGNDWDYLDGDGMILVSDNHCLLMPSGLHPKSMEQYLRNLLIHGREMGIQIPELIARFGLLPIANQSVVQKIYKKGIKQINLDVGQYSETSRETYDNRPRKIVEQLSDGFREILMSLISSDEDRHHIEEADNVSAKLIIKLDKRRPGLMPEDLSSVAERIASEDEDDIEIETMDGQKVRKGTLICSKQVEIDSFAKTIHHNHAWEEMSNYFQTLKDSGMLGE